MPESILSVQGLCKEVQDASGQLAILRDISFELGAGQTVAIVGASGSGKSTLLGILAGLDTPSRGRVALAGQNLFALDEDARAALRAQHVGFVFQSFQLMANLTALENVAPVIAVVFDDELLETVPTEDHDHPVDAAITPSSTTRFSERLN